MAEVKKELSGGAGSVEAAKEGTRPPVEEVKRIQIYSNSSSSSSARQITPFWKEKYERDARKYWDIFYKRHQDKFFKDRHYLDKEWGSYFQVKKGDGLVILEAGCGAGNTIFPLIALYPDIFVHACDFSSRAIDLVKGHKDYRPTHINAFVCDLRLQNLSEIIQPSSLDIVTMVFMLSAVAPEKMPSVLQNIRKVLKPTGLILFRDYATGDLAQERLTCKEQKISENFYVRGDGTHAYYFSESFLARLFMENGFDVVEIAICNKHVENRSLELSMNRRWIQAVFSNKPDGQTWSSHDPDADTLLKDHAGTEVDISDCVVSMFEMSPSIDEVIEINVRGYDFRVKALAKEHQHTCKSTGLMLWESARLMCNLIAENPSVVGGKRVLELGCGSAGICSMIAVHFAEVVVSTDGDSRALELLRQNMQSNLSLSMLDRVVTKKLVWGNREDVEDIKGLSTGGGFDLVIGTDVTYNYDAILPLFETARELVSSNHSAGEKPALMLCHIQRRVDEGSIISTASQFGFKLVDRWVNGNNQNGGIISSWICEGASYLSDFKNAPLTILYFHA